MWISRLALAWFFAIPAIALAADDPTPHWAFQPVKRSNLPAAKRVANPIDAFVQARWAEEGLKPAKPTDRRTLIRRLTLDLTGLPPTPDEIDGFVADQNPDVYAKLVNRLLASPAYGERWGRHWLDVVRYAETNGYERDGAKPDAWRYRDYVIQSLNADKPFDRFLTEQLAGDELPDASPETRIATTFLRLGTWDDEPADPVLDRFDQLDDIVGTTATAFLGITLRCARCHDHKFEPFSQAEYYSFLAAFDPLKRPQVGREEYSISVEDASVQASHLSNSLQRVAALPLGAGAVTRSAWLPPDRGRTGHIFEEEAKPPVTRVLKRGNPKQPLATVEPGIPGILKPGPADRPSATGKSSGRRLWLARWMTRPENPLTARVIANRIWQGHFGVGLVASSNDFGVAGDEPTHPELLDWLASELVRQKWSLKALHRLIVTSATYQLSSDLDESTLAADSDNALLTHWKRRRLEAEAVRDATLAVSGDLMRTQGGPSVCPPIPRAVLEGQSRPGEGWITTPEPAAFRRSIYIHAKRALVPPELELLDTPDTTTSCERRPISTTGPQALTFLNGDFIQKQADHLATRLEREAGNTPSAQITLAYRLALGRVPTANELATIEKFLADQAALIRSESAKPPAEIKHQALRAFCLALLNLNEFVFLD